MSHALVVDADAGQGEILASLLNEAGLTAATVRSVDEARRRLAMQPAQWLFVDQRLHDVAALERLRDIDGLARARVVLTGAGTGSTAGDDRVAVLPRVEAAALQSLLGHQAPAPGTLPADADWRDTWERTGCYGGLLWGRSAAMQRLHRQIARVAGTSVSVFLVGETGTGKDVVARTLHALGRRRSQPFLALNCGAVSPHLVESEIFGHEKGSFTGADRQHQGYFERAHGGTLFLDEVTEMPPGLQVKLLRVLETGHFTRVGSTQALPCDVRILAATNRDPRQAVVDGRLREDLYHRLNAFPITLPPLRERSDDVPLLAAVFVQDIGEREGQPRRFTEAALARLARRRWPGNVRELRNAVQRAYVMADAAEIDEAWLADEDGDVAAIATPAQPSAATATPEAGASLTLPLGQPLQAMAQAYARATLRHAGGRREVAAAMLGLSRKALEAQLADAAGDAAT